MISIKVPAIGESISEVTLVKWIKPDGSYVERDEVIAEFESEKATFELNAEQAGTLKTLISEGDTVAIGAVVCEIDTEAKKPENTGSSTPNKTAAPEEKEKAATLKKEANKQAPTADTSHEKPSATPVAKAIMDDKKVDAAEVKGSGTQGKILKQDVLQALNAPGIKGGATTFSREDRREKMSNLRKTVSRRLVDAKNTTAMLTTFNEVDMTRIMDIRAKYKDAFKEKYGVGLGFMSFFTKAVCYALQEYPAVNAYIDGQEIIYHNYCDISIAVSAPKGLVVPIIRNAESLNMQEIEKAVVELATKAKENKLSLEEMTGGTFTITNGGVFGSLMSTPIINIPQSAILGMHKIQERPMAIHGQVVIRPMMYVALSYDHRIIDGRESVGFLVHVKELLENPEGLLIGQEPVKALLGL